METICTTANPPGKQEGLPSPLLLDTQSQYVTEEIVNQLGRYEVSSVTMDIWVSTMEAYLNNQGRQL